MLIIIKLDVMKLKKEFSNAVLIFIGVAVYFIILELLGLSKIYYLRLLNALFVIFGVARTISRISVKAKGII